MQGHEPLYLRRERIRLEGIGGHKSVIPKDGPGEKFTCLDCDDQGTEEELKSRKCQLRNGRPGGW